MAYNAPISRSENAPMGHSGVQVQTTYVVVSFGGLVVFIYILIYELPTPGR